MYILTNIEISNNKKISTYYVGILEGLLFVKQIPKKFCWQQYKITYLAKVIHVLNPQKYLQKETTINYHIEKAMKTSCSDDIYKYSKINGPTLINLLK